MGWTAEQTNQTLMPDIELAYEGRGEMLAAIFGDGSKPAQGEPEEGIADRMKAALRGMAANKGP